MSKSKKEGWNVEVDLGIIALIVVVIMFFLLLMRPVEVKGKCEFDDLNWLNETVCMIGGEWVRCPLPSRVECDFSVKMPYALSLKLKGD